MGSETGISWTDATWNPFQGCHKVSTGCKNCYMFSEKTRYGQNPNVVVRSSDATFNAPLKWARNTKKYGHIKRVFVCSWSDFFIEEADSWRADAWEIMRKTPQFIYQLCTKRPERIASCLPSDWGQGYSNVWLLTSTENQEAADLRIPILLSIPAVVHGISAEPLLGPLDISEALNGYPRRLSEISYVSHEMASDAGDLTLEGSQISGDEWEQTSPPLTWVIVGGESGPNARPCNVDWTRSIVSQCKQSKVPVFVKQLGSHVIQDGERRIKRDSKGGDMSEWPHEIRIREFPKG